MNKHIPNPPATLETPRLRLRLPTMEDAPSIYERYASDPEVTRLLSWRPHKDVEATRTFLGSLLKALEAGSMYAWIIEGRTDRRLMGLMSMAIETAREDDFLSTEEERRYYKVRFGYHLSRSEWGKGFATEAAQAIVQWAMAQPEVYRVWTICDVENHASARVLEKAGLIREGTLKRWGIHPNVSAEPRDFYCYALVK